MCEKYEQGDELEIWFLVGGGGGHEIHINDLKLTIKVINTEAGKPNEEEEKKEGEETKEEVKDNAQTGPQISDFNILKLIGTGEFASVFLV